jgi:CBS-domain-containing membrane protein
VYLSLYVYNHDHALLLVIASIAASVVLIFTVPHGAMSQPWPVMGSYLLSGIVGVTCNQLIPDTLLAATAAVSLSILVMQYGRCVHPPGGAVALIAVIGNEPLQTMGYGFVVGPVLLNALALIIAGILFNSSFRWRRYPVHLLYLTTVDHPILRKHDVLNLERDSLEHALRTIDTYVDIDIDDLLEIVECAREHALKKDPARLQSALQAAATLTPQ